MTSTTTVASSPGNVVLLGGCYKLIPSQCLLSLSTPGRVFAFVKAAAAGSTGIRVFSRNFSDPPLWYKVITTESGVVSIEGHEQNTHNNALVKWSLKWALEWVSTTMGSHHVVGELAGGVDISIIADYCFYYTQLSPFDYHAPLDVPFGSIFNTIPTGFGASAALVTALLASFLVHLRAISVPLTMEGHEIILRLALHVIRESGIHGYAPDVDVAVSVTGSKFYSRNPHPNFYFAGSTSLRDTFSSQYVPSPFRLPPCLQVVIAFVDNERQLTPCVEFLSTDLRAEERHHEFIATLHKLSSFSERDRFGYQKALSYIASVAPVQWLADPFMAPEMRAVLQCFDLLRTVSQRIRRHTNTAVVRVGVRCETEIQSKALDACFDIRGVVAGGTCRVDRPRSIWLILPQAAMSSALGLSPKECVDAALVDMGLQASLMTIEAEAAGGIHVGSVHMP